MTTYATTNVWHRGGGPCGALDRQGCPDGQPESRSLKRDGTEADGVTFHEAAPLPAVPSQPDQASWRSFDRV